MNAFGLAPFLLILPLIGFLFNGIWGKDIVAADAKSGERLSGWFGVAMAAGTFIVSVLIFLSLSANGHHAETVVLWDWFNIPSANFRIQWAMYFDTLSSTMLLVVTGVGSLIHIYAMGYMHGDKDYARFFALINLFLFFMLILVTGNNYLMLFVGWEGVGLCSFMLVGFWFDKPDGVGLANGDAARKAFVANRVGDFAMILAMILTFWVFGTMEFEPVFASALDMYASGEMVTLAGYEFHFGGVLKFLTLLFLIGATGKSAQIPLFIWLPDAMAGPTPVSALIHAATMVTSGIYLITRSNVLFEIARIDSHALLGGVISTPNVVAIVGAVTAVYAGLVAFTQFDVKKVLAYSTVSQLGFMIAAVGMGAYIAGMFHLITHAFFKALLFMGSGSIIHGMEHGHHHLHDHHGHDDDHKDHHDHAEHPGEDHHDDFDPQDMRFMGGLRHKMPVTFWTYMVGTLALAGIFPFAGFWSKDEILAHASVNAQDLDSVIFNFVYIMLSVAAFCTAFYMGRQIKMVFFGEPRHEAVEYVPESNNLMTRPLVALAVLALIGGFLNFPYIGSAPDSYAETSGVVASVVAAEEGSKGFNLALEHWLVYSIQSFKLSEAKDGVQELYMPHTPIVLQWNVAILSTIFAVGALGISFFLVFRDWPNTSKDKDPLEVIPGVGSIWSWFQSLPIDSLLMKGWVKGVFMPMAAISERIDWDFWHNFFHENVIRDTFLATADFFSTVLDPKGIDGAVNGVGSTLKQIGNILRRAQTGNVGNYALGLFLGVALVVAYFVLNS